METQTKNFIKYLIFPLVLAVGLVQYYAVKAGSDYLMHVHFFDVGQGDGLLITTYQGNQVLVDGGPGKKILEELGGVMPYFDHTIEMIMLTHPHNDHMEGLIPVLEKYEVKKIVMANVEYKSSTYEEFLKKAKDENAEIIYAIQGQRFYLDQSTVLDILYPTINQVIKPKKSDEINDTSIVAKLTFGGTKMLLTGDAGIEIEKKLLFMFDLNVDVLKVGHHGSKYSSSKELIDETTPEYAVIQVGENKYGHPSQEALKNLSQTKILRNDERGRIELVSDGSTVKLIE